ncbi:uncharacterized protein OCT59_026819 [Rhizophagus irregularis]|uniref:Uncharacterized protein n=2 Tax=Rhizophagus irregularis TaxID=588596 RepID=A0A015KF99_RHIIW|nr:hypothetical protein GLOIN_2v1480819 [Rhizophagus irregularis DAOM 181602=DAOM 197198]EXX78305.1 hypothetical protein RirG_016180 [Rhizophagus irregularis DAOM 197198w]UZO06499.1 hypothetical protein OCT59_026819 [Rhizophagus irregularis]POG68392.1 hypothetical protein GLOIN_2v1480819 [Rhizophagus irregularis DAOM 181602=DAOM 197198]CAG8558464.1 16915_t:CDS:1 [Rhizophagus irregularis]GBC16257.2 hypothetical protein GLOIN_2v1480819 [Rhizophagus irregularis DAOM 181602=DAOM 197198]|eukprot:XP_025175258.1 hypothetical protein GLOIN_2v1480819 [Rhizophagus irregularis DAOM 181602=DAOM 197198]
MSPSYNPAEDTINSILIGLLPVLIVGLFNGFKDGKRKKLSMINIFDDFFIFASIVIFPLITAIEWYQYYSNYYKREVIVNYAVTALFGIISYILFLWVQYKKEDKEKIKEENNENVEGKKIDERGNGETSINVDDENGNNKNKKINGGGSIKKLFTGFIKFINEIFEGEMLACYFILVLTILSYSGYDAFIHGDLGLNNNANKVYSHMSNYCIKNFGINKCNSLRLANRIIYIFGIVVYTLHASCITILHIRKLRESILIRYVREFQRITNFPTIFKFFKHINIMLLIVYPAIVSGYLISTSPIITRIAFGICTLSFTRLVNHFNEKPDNINTLISIYLNGEVSIKDKKQQIETLTEEIKQLTKVINNQTNVINNLTNQLKENK